MRIRGLFPRVQHDCRSRVNLSQWFAAEGIQPCRVLYEELDADPVRVASGVLSFLGLDLSSGREITVRHKRLVDDLNARWTKATVATATAPRGKPSGAGASPAGTGGCGG